MSNSEQEVKRLAQNLYDLTEQRKRLTKEEEEAKKELLAFVDNGAGVVPIQSPAGKIVVAEFGEKPTVTSNIDAKSLYELSQKLGMEKEFWDSVKVVLSEARSKFPPMALEKITDYKESVSWKISYK